MKRTDSPSKNARNLTPEVARETDAERVRAIVASLQNREPSSEEVFDAFWQLDALPVNDVRDAFTSWLGPLPDPDTLDPATRRAHGFPPPALRLRTLSIARDADVLDLGPVAEAQLRLAGTTWDGADIAPEDRLDGELEGSFAGTVERRVLADAGTTEGAPLFDVLLFAEDSGVVFASGSTTVIALIAYRKVETRDRRLRTAIEDALYAQVKAPLAETGVMPREEPIEAIVVLATKVTPKEVAPKATSVPKTAAKKTPAKKSAAKKAVAKKPLAKKAPTKKVVTKPSAKKLPAKKSAAKKTPAKKSAAKKAVAKKPLAKKAPTKKVAQKKIAPAKKSPKRR